MGFLIREEVIQRMKNGDVTAFDELYSETADKVYRTVYILASNKQDVDDIVSEIYYQVWKSIHSYRETTPFLYWLNGLMFRQVKNWKLKSWRRMILFQKKMRMESEHSYLVEEDILKAENKQHMIMAMDNMSYKLKEVVVLYYFHDYSLKEIASLLNIPIGTVKSRHHLALKRLRKTFEDSFVSGKADSLYVK
jgi:RNA polymerase sigma-70 factor, ECF subfamily